ncbi:MFS transporter [Flavobacterium suaedae]|uniref:MFS transporter n=1 Tax=Flavobacterium suaedae TaxID=1767027 RepID=A0ABQ1JXB3_9FLAO|nr:MFS transporter [Flavobacterium suaedae]GGB76410.1 MFS transporter [Flavobacterium suaedae]
MQEKIKLKEKIAYGFGDAASSMYWKIFSMYLLFFYTDVFGLAAATVGTMFLVTKAWDSFFDPFVGIYSDRVQSRWGKFRPFLLWMAVPFAVIGMLTFYTPDVDTKSKLVYAYVTYSIMMMAYSLINVPYASLLGVMTSNGKERTALATFRMVFAFAGSLVALGAIEPLVIFFGGSLTSSTGWFYTLVVFGIVATLLFWGCFAGTKERIKPIKEEQSSLKQDLSDLISNKAWLILVGAGIATILFNTIRDGAAIYYFKYVVGAAEDENYSILGISISLTGVYLVLGQAANIIGVIIATPVANTIGKKRTFLGAMFLAAVLSAIFYLIPPTGIEIIMLFQFLISICAGCVFPLLWSMYADTADFGEWKDGRRATGLLFSASSMSQKLGWAVGGAVTGWLLAYYGFKANVVQTAFTQTGIQLMLSFLPAAGAVISMLFMFLYPLSEEKLKVISRELDERRATKESN